MGLQGERPMVELTGDPESGGMQDSGGGQEVELYRFPLLLNQRNARTVKGSQGSRSSWGGMHCIEYCLGSYCHIYKHNSCSL